MNLNRRSRSPSRFSPIDEHPKNGISPANSQKHSPQSHIQTAQVNLGSEKFDTFRSNGSHSAVNEPVSRRSSGFQQNKGSKENLFNDPIVIPITHINSIPRLSVDVKNGNENGNENEQWEKHDVQVKYHNERIGYPSQLPPAAYYHPMYYEDYGYNNRLQFPHQTMLSPSHKQHHYYPQPDYSISSKSIKKAENVVYHDTMKKNVVSTDELLSSTQTTKSTKSQKKNLKKLSNEKKQKVLKPRIYRKIHCCCFSFIWPPFAYEICEPPQPMYPKQPKSKHI
uniref:Uncharacterized protein n=1 Tax=Panagrolaimus sp. PS1159 TaxID=55785 RepID=A0AC35GJ28_9BILA